MNVNRANMLSIFHALSELNNQEGISSEQFTSKEIKTLKIILRSLIKEKDTVFIPIKSQQALDALKLKLWSKQTKTQQSSNISKIAKKATSIFNLFKLKGLQSDIEKIGEMLGNNPAETDKKKGDRLLQGFEDDLLKLRMDKTRTIEEKVERAEKRIEDIESAIKGLKGFSSEVQLRLSDKLKAMKTKWENHRNELVDQLPVELKKQRANELFEDFDTCKLDQKEKEKEEERVAALQAVDNEIAEAKSSGKSEEEIQELEKDRRRLIKDPKEFYEMEFEGKGEKDAVEIRGQLFSGQTVRDFSSALKFNNVSEEPGENEGQDKLYAAFAAIVGKIIEGGGYFSLEKMQKAAHVALAYSNQAFDSDSCEVLNEGIEEINWESSGLDKINPSSREARRVTARYEEGKIIVQVKTVYRFRSPEMDEEPFDGKIEVIRECKIDVKDASVDIQPTRYEKLSGSS